MEGMTRYDAQTMLIGKAVVDETFRKDLIANPKAVLQKEFGAELPADVEVEVLEFTPKKAYVVIPVRPAGDVEVPKESDAKTAFEKMILRAWSDEAFKEEVLASPKTALNKVDPNTELPDDLEVEALEETAQKAYILLPSERPSELSDEDLEAVSGGHISGAGFPRPIIVRPLPLPWK